VCQQILVTAPLADALGEALAPTGVSGADEVDAALEGLSQTLYHPAATCALGTAPDAVLDPSCRVRGTEALRVVDASAIPRLPRGHTHAATVLLAERAADLIRGHTPRAAGAGANANAGG
jgi:choline dehydrogenase